MRQRLFVFLEQVFSVGPNVEPSRAGNWDLLLTRSQGAATRGLGFAEWSGQPLRAGQEAPLMTISVNDTLCILPLHGNIALALFCI
jgi:hypothetical protein